MWREPNGDRLFIGRTDAQEERNARPGTEETAGHYWDTELPATGAAAAEEPGRVKPEYEAQHGGRAELLCPRA